MTEQEWLACDRPHWMLNHLRPWKKRGRKMCLYVCASCYRRDVWGHLKEPCRILLGVAERHADGLIEPDEYKAAKQAFSKLTKRDKRADGEYMGQVLLDFLRLKHLPGWEGAAPAVERYNYLSDEARHDREAMRRRGMNVITEEMAVDVQRESEDFMEDHTNLLRDIFGNPFHPVTLDLSMLTPTAIQLAQAIYNDHAFGRMSDLADALHDAGCDNEEILGHCRGPGPHVRGCWVVDMVSGKE